MAISRGSVARVEHRQTRASPVVDLMHSTCRSPALIGQHLRRLWPSLDSLQQNATDVCRVVKAWVTVSKTVRPMQRDRCLSVLSACRPNVGVLWPNGWIDQDTTCCGGRPRPRQHCVSWGPSSPWKGAQQPPLCRLYLLWPLDGSEYHTTWYEGRPRPRRYCVRWGPS